VDYCYVKLDWLIIKRYGVRGYNNTLWRIHHFQQQQLEWTILKVANNIRAGKIKPSILIVIELRYVNTSYIMISIALYHYKLLKEKSFENMVWVIPITVLKQESNIVEIQLTNI